jgi:hypothetical protein
MIAMLLFISAWCCLILFFLQGMQDYYLLLLMIGLFIGSYFVAPYSKGRESSSGAWDVYAIEFFFEMVSLPIRLIIFLVRHVVD